VLTLVLILLVLWFVLGAFLAAWTLFFQGYIYSEPARDLHWRAPAAGTALALFLTVWVLLVRGNPGRLGVLTDFTASDEREWSELWTVDRDGKKLVYYKRIGTPPLYRSRGEPNGRPLPTRPEGILVKDGDKEVIFKPDRDANGKFKVEEVSFLGSKQTQMLKYRDERGRVMTEDQPGRVSTFRTGWFLANLLLNGLHLAVWWVCLWLLLQFQWSHALGLALVMWLVMMLAVLPPVFRYAERSAAPAPPPAAASAEPGAGGGHRNLERAAGFIFGVCFPEKSS
jgi:hypothetical protein